MYILYKWINWWRLYIKLKSTIMSKRQLLIFYMYQIFLRETKTNKNTMKQRSHKWLHSFRNGSSAPLPISSADRSCLVVPCSIATEMAYSRSPPQSMSSHDDWGTAPPNRSYSSSSRSTGHQSGTHSTVSASGRAHSGNTAAYETAARTYYVELKKFLASLLAKGMAQAT